MGFNSDLLVSNYSIPKEAADSLINFTKGDIELGIKIIESAEQNVIAVKVKFASPKRNTFGATIFFYNISNSTLEYSWTVICGDKELGKLEGETNWTDFISEMTNYMNGKDADPENAKKIDSNMFDQNTMKYLSSILIDKSLIDSVNLKRLLMSIIGSILGDTSLMLKVSVQAINYFKMKNFLSNITTGTKNPSKSSLNDIVFINIKTNPILSAVEGKAVEELMEGDELPLKIVDTRDIIPYIAALMQPYMAPNKTIFGKVISNKEKPGTGNRLVTVSFFPGILGHFLINPTVKVQIRQIVKESVSKTTKKEMSDTTQIIDNKQQTSAQSQQQEIRQNIKLKNYNQNNSSLIVIGAIVVGIIIFIIIIFYITSS